MRGLPAVATPLDDPAAPGDGTESISPPGGNAAASALGLMQACSVFPLTASRNTHPAELPDWKDASGRKVSFIQ